MEPQAAQAHASRKQANLLIIYGSRAGTWPSRETGIGLQAAVNNLRLCMGNNISSISNVK